MSTPIQNNTIELENVLEQVRNLPDRGSGSTGGIDCLVKNDIALADEILEFVIEEGYINPAASGDNIIYTDNNGIIYII